MSKRKQSTRFQNIASFFRAGPSNDRDKNVENIQQNEHLPTETETTVSAEAKSKSEEVEQLDLSTKDQPTKAVNHSFSGKRRSQIFKQLV